LMFYVTMALSFLRYAIKKNFDNVFTLIRCFLAVLKIFYSPHNW